MIISRLAGWGYFVILRDGKLGGGWYLIKVRDVTIKRFNEVFLYNQRKDCIYGMRNPKVACFIAFICAFPYYFVMQIVL